ncbi:MAG TPA: copper homeostasis protein CutC [Propionicimonas sp.]|nr:copper homeostasis protein CutC [Propionicimonas sp.]HQA78372.1 copper homeostasis protein CutC [Propionicimonas sp.]HQD97476.1 copper homeostasis protein CutC [Propionicimonas sp.]
MSGLLEVIALLPADAERAEAGGADRIELCGTLDEDGLSPTPQLVDQVRRATSIQLRVMVRLRAGFGTDGGEAVRLRGLMASYADAGADGMVLGFLNGLGDVDVGVVTELVGDGTWPWTFHRAVDACLDADKAWAALRTLPRLDQVLTAGSARDVEHGLSDLLARAKADPWAASVIMAGGGLHPDHVPWLARAGVRAFHIGKAARPGGSFKAYVDEALVRSWRSLVDAEVRHRPTPAAAG